MSRVPLKLYSKKFWRPEDVTLWVNANQLAEFVVSVSDSQASLATSRYIIVWYKYDREIPD